jgi:tetratricopeptide (TPR) repeat protein
MARDREQDLTGFEMLQVDVVESLVQGNLEGAAVACRGLATLAPAHFSYCAGTMTLGIGRPGEALRYLTTLDPRIVPQAWYTSAQMYIARAHHMLGDFQQEIEVSRRAQLLYPGSLPLIEGEVRALLSIGRVSEADSLMENRLIEPASYPTVPPDLVVWSTSGSVLTYLALEARAHGHQELYRRWIERAVEWHHDRTAEGAHIDAMAMVRALYYAERWAEAQERLDVVSKDDPGNVECLGHFAVLAVRLGDLERARTLDQKLASLNTRALSGANLLWRARVAALLVEGRRAVELLNQAQHNGWSFNIWHHVEPDFESLAGYPAFVEFLTPKG